MMSPYSKKIYGMMMREISIMGPYQISRVCERAGINQFLVAEKDLPYLGRELSRIVVAYRGPEHAKKFANEFNLLYNLDALIEVEPDPETRIEYLLDMGDLQRLIGSWDDAENYYDAVIIVAKQNDKHLHHCRALRKLGNMFAMKSDLDRAREALQQAKKISDEQEDRLEKAKIHRELAYLNWRLGRFESALRHIEKALNIAYSLNNKHLVGELMIRTATVQNDMGNPDETVGQLKKTIPVLESIEDYINIARAYNNIGVTLKRQDQLDAALEHYHKSLEAAEKTESPRSRAYPLANAAECYARKGDLDKAAEYAGKAQQIFTNLGERFMLARLKIVYAIVAERQGKLEDAEELLKSGIGLYRELSIPNDLAWVLYDAGLLYKKWGRKEAGECLAESEKIFGELGNEVLADKVRSALKG